MTKKTLFISFIITALLSSATLAMAAAGKPRKPGPTDKCAVCGMFVANYANFAAQVHLKDGKVLYFDGSKDLFRFYHEVPRYAPGRKAGDVAAVFVTGYYDATLIDGTTAFYVIGSDVAGPMGSELIPFAKEADAREFLKDHHGRKIVRFREVTPAVLAQVR
ncbi:nitrous oxide reductase accessory protein NosL [Geomonas subterranea]|uniref:Nitrous oxide reductase accessory protein NosL n=1 Tax=Geomonas subterranea TaxID=2847989 RepID=A0ABX8LMC1_9BACT|nr:MULTISPECIES: nitrous oxide reductase accessory protein NosL [Geomonas]QXE91373.1 nitrous oxide reductase accessory protein NosL [Geomonas subterranea]QXM10540.1 nitrous oxide reductase accessory protein NosL [Geomonas subterranea]